MQSDTPFSPQIRQSQVANSGRMDIDPRVGANCDAAKQMAALFYGLLEGDSGVTLSRAN